MTVEDLASYAAAWSDPVDCDFAGRRVRTRAGLSGLPETLARFDPAGGADALLDALERGRTIDGHTTNITVIDAEGSACVLTSSLGLGSGDWLPGLDLHLNSMLGELDLVREPLRAGARMESMMAPTLVFDGGGLELAIGSAGGTRLRTALVGVLGAVLHEGASASAGDRPAAVPSRRSGSERRARCRRALARRPLEARGTGGAPLARRLHHYFGGVERDRPHRRRRDPRRSGAVSFA